MSARRAGLLHLGLTALVVLFHLALVLGAPWGAVTMGGAWPGVLPLPVRGLSALSALLSAGLTVVVLAEAGVLSRRPPRWALKLVIGFSLLAVIANAATRSAPERIIWLPVTLVMLGAVLVVAWQRGAGRGRQAPPGDRPGPGAGHP